MAHRAHRKQHQPTHPVSARNACGKVAHQSRRDARKVASQYPADRLRAYRCPDCRCWHLGHIPKPIARGDFTAREIYGGQPA